MQHFKTSFLYHIIYIGFSTLVCAQNIELSVLGSDAKETIVLDSISYSKFFTEESQITKELNTIHEKLNTIGYLKSVLQEHYKKNDSLYVARFNLGSQIKRIKIDYSNTIISEELLQNFSNDISTTSFTVPFSEVENILKELNEKLSALGYSFNTVQLKNIKPINATTLQATLMLENVATPRKVDKVIVKGYEKFPKSYVKHFLKIKPNRVLDLSAITAQTKKIEQIPFASQLKEPEILFKKDSSLLYVYLKKVKRNNFDGFLGFGTNEDSRKLDITGYLNLILENNLNYGESLQLQYRSDENAQRSFNTKIDAPYLFNTPIGVSLGLQIFKKDSSFTTTNQNIKLRYQILPEIYFAGGTSSEKSSNLLKNESTSILDYTTNLWQLELAYTKWKSLNMLINTNFYSTLQIGFGKRTTKETQEKQTKIEAEIYNTFLLNKKNNLYLRANGAVLFSTTFLENELFRFGGINSIRGFEENSLTATQFIVLNSEYRYYLSKALYAHSIIDFAYTKNNLIPSSNQLYSFGFGFALATKSGLFKFNYANGTTKGIKSTLSDSKIHLSLTAFF